MTCIVGLVDSGTVYMGADSAAVSGWDTRITALEKVFLKDDFLIGYTTSFRMGQILQHQLKMPSRHTESEYVQGRDMPVMEYMVTVFVECVRDCLKKYGYSKIENNQEEGGDILLGYEGRLFRIGSDFQVNEYADGFAAIGGGYAYALGALQALVDIPARQRVRQALEISAYFSNGVTGPFYVEGL